MTMETLVRVAVGRGLSMACSISSIVSGCRLGSSRRMAGEGNLTSTSSAAGGPTSVSVCYIVYTSRLPMLLFFQHREADGQVKFKEEFRTQKKTSQATALVEGSF